SRKPGPRPSGGPRRGRPHWGALGGATPPGWKAAAPRRPPRAPRGTGKPRPGGGRRRGGWRARRRGERVRRGGGRARFCSGLGSALLLLGLGLAWGLQYWPRVRGWVQALWPEQLVGLGLLVYFLDGRLPVAAALVLLGAGARLFYLLRAAAALWPRHAARTTP